MANIIFNRQLSSDFFLLKAGREDHTEQPEQTRQIKIPEPGQFYMVRAWERYPVLSRPLSVFDADDESVTFLYRVVGEGTEMLAARKAGDGLTLCGPYGNTFPMIGGSVALVGGGAGTAPLYFAARRLRERKVAARADAYLGFSGAAILEEEFGRTADSVKVNVGGLITDDIEPDGYNSIFACGPEIMMRTLYEKCLARNAADLLWVSLESRMACGVGACLVCGRKTALTGSRKVCKDGPIFPGKAVFGI